MNVSSSVSEIYLNFPSRKHIRKSELLFAALHGLEILELNIDIMYFASDRQKRAIYNKKVFFHNLLLSICYLLVTRHGKYHKILLCYYFQLKLLNHDYLGDYSGNKFHIFLYYFVNSVLSYHMIYNYTSRLAKDTRSQ